jgi:serine protease Do
MTWAAVRNQSTAAGNTRESFVTPQILTRTMPRPNHGLMWLMALAILMLQTAGLRASPAPESFADLIEKVGPSVVNITTSSTIAASDGPGPMVPEGSPLEDFFRDFLDRRQQPDNRPRRSSALGSGFVISEDGYIVTNNHVIEEADEVVVEFSDGVEMDAKVVGVDPNTDIALLKVDSDTALPALAFGDSDEMKVGDWVLAIGNPLGQGHSASAGIVSARNRELSGAYDDYIQTDAAINRGNSGGPLFNMAGEVIGVNTAILSPDGGSIGIGFSMASNVVDDVVLQLKEFGETRRGWLGVRIQDVTDDVADAMGLEIPAGALISDVPEGPARDAGLEAGDVIVTFDGEPIEDTRELVRAVADTTVGKVVPVEVIRNGNREVIEVTLGRREEAERTVPAAMDQDGGSIEGEMLGLTVSVLTVELRDQLGLDDDVQGLVVLDVDPSSGAYEKGMRAGDLIEEAGQEQVSTIEDLENRVDAAREAGRKSLLLLVRRDGDPRFVALSLTDAE